MHLILLNTLILFNLSVKDLQTGSPIPLVQVVCLDHGEGSISDENGEIRLQLEPGSHRLQISHIAYHPKIIDLTIPAAESRISIKLEPRILQMPGVQIEESAVAEYDVPVITGDDIRQRILLAEPDVFRALSLLPAISNTSDFASGPAIRGLSPNFTHIYLDEAPVLNPYHVGGLFSAFDYGMIESVKIYPGVAPVQYGDYGSGMIRLLPRFVPKNETQIEMGLISARLRTLQSLHPNWQTGLVLRYFTPQIINRILTGKNYDYYFYDLHWTNQHRLFSDLLIQSNLYYSNEIMPNSISRDRAYPEYLEKIPAYQNLIFSASAKLGAFKLCLYYSKAPTEMKTNLNQAENQMVKYGVKVYNTISRPNSLIKTGFEVEKTVFDYHWHFYRSALEAVLGYPPQYMFFDDAPGEFDAHFRYSRIAAFAELSRTFLRRGDTSAGLRFERYRNHIYSMPRVTLKQSWNNWQVTTGYGLVYQFSFAKNDKGQSEFFNPFIIRFPAADRPVGVHTISLEIIPPISGFSTVIYFRKFEQLPVYDWNRAFYHFSTGFSGGLEATYERRLSNADLQINYSGSLSRIARANQWQKSSQDRPHQLKMAVNFPLGRHWHCGWQFQLASGNLYSTPTHWLPIYSMDLLNGEPMDFIPRFAQPNNRRYPFYHRLDLSLEREWQVPGGTLIGKLSVLNLYNHQNHFYTAYAYEYYSYILDEKRTQINEKTNLPVLPTIYLVYTF